MPHPKTPPLPYWRLSNFYLFYFAALGALVPYWSLYLKDLGFTVEAIGQLMAILMATKVVAPYVWGWLGDRRGLRLGIVRAASLIAALSYLGVLLAPGFWALALVMLVFSFFWNAALPQFEAITMNHLGARADRYAQIRLWGSIGFVVTAAGIGPLLEITGTATLPIVVFVCLLAIWLSTLLATESAAAPNGHAAAGSIFDTLRQPVVLSFLALCFLMQASHGPYYAFYSVYLENFGYSRPTIGLLWALGVVAEVLVFLVMHRLLARVSLRQAMLMAMVLTALRWWLLAQWVQLDAVVWGAQLLHAASFGVFHAVSIQIIHRLFVGPQQGRGQALYSAVSFGAGGAVGALASGYVWAQWAPADIFTAAAAAAALGGLVAWFGLRGPAVERDVQAPGKTMEIG